jgi:predicted DNA-binding transcriptional regulator YafY
MAERVRRFRRPQADGPAPQVPMIVQRAIAEQLVVAIDYLDREASLSRREVEPIGVVSLDEVWHLVGWCRRRQGTRSFRIDRIHGAELTGDLAPVAIQKSSCSRSLAQSKIQARSANTGQQGATIG